MSGIYNSINATRALAGGFYGKVTVDKIASRAAGVLYTNSSGRPRKVSISILGVVAGTCDAFLESSTGLLYSGNAVYSNATAGNSHFTLAEAIINDGENYRLVIVVGTLSTWVETS